MADSTGRHAILRIEDVAAYEESTRELEILEDQTRPSAQLPSQRPHLGLKTAPIPASWVLEGAPTARSRLLHQSSDRLSSTYLWDCTAGRFSWHYDVDETICLVEGSVTLVDSAKGRFDLRAGDTFFFPKGSRFEWHVTNYVRKVANIYSPLSRRMQLLRRALSALRKVVTGRRAGNRLEAL